MSRRTALDSKSREVKVVLLGDTGGPLSQSIVIPISLPKDVSDTEVVIDLVSVIAMQTHDELLGASVYTTN